MKEKKRNVAFRSGYTQTINSIYLKHTLSTHKHICETYRIYQTNTKHALIICETNLYRAYNKHISNRF
jgi:hypothetical protein